MHTIGSSSESVHAARVQLWPSISFPGSSSFKRNRQLKHSSCSWPQHCPATSCCAVDVGCSSLSITAVVGSDCVLASIPWRKSRGEGRGDSETDRREEGLRGFWLLAPVGGKKKLTRKEGRFHIPVLRGSLALTPGAGTPGPHGL